MSEAMKKPYTGGQVEVRLRFPVALAEVQQAMVLKLLWRPLPQSRSSISWEEAYPDFIWSLANIRCAFKREHPDPKRIIPLAEVSHTHISNGEYHEEHGKEMASRLAKVLKVNYRVFLYAHRASRGGRSLKGRLARPITIH